MRTWRGARRGEHPARRPRRVLRASVEQRDDPRLRGEIRERVGLPITVVVARTKFLAKVASGVAKPDGLLVGPPDGELAFLHRGRDPRRGARLDHGPSVPLLTD
ncbi:MAG TPA: hypothetical protein VKD26_09415 [Streptosporangiaceae bacterium]|nr:hypothetical protein [Streptosporangiaceae bacterium]